MSNREMGWQLDNFYITGISINLIFKLYYHGYEIMQGVFHFEKPSKILIY